MCMRGCKEDAWGRCGMSWEETSRRWYRAGTQAKSHRALQAIVGDLNLFLSEREAPFEVLSRNPRKTELQFLKFYSGCRLDNGPKGIQNRIKGDSAEG